MQVPDQKLINTIEHQIETMLDQVMEEKETEYKKLSFSNDDDVEEGEHTPSYQTETDISRSIRLSFVSSSSESQNFQRNNRKLRNTYSLSSNIPNGFMPMINPLFNYPMVYPQQTTIERSQGRKKTVESNIYPMTPWINPNMIQYQEMTSKQKRFNTTAIPQGINLKFEMMVHDISALLANAEKIDYFIYGKIKNNFAAILKTHKGSRMFQNYLKNTHIDIIHQLFAEIEPEIYNLMTDQYANYFCKRFFTILNQKDRVDFLQSIKDNIIKLSVDSIGTYPFQGIIEEVGSKIEKSIILNSISNSLPELSTDLYGTHVLEKIVSCFEEEFATCIYDYIINNFMQLATHTNGICIVKKILMLTHKRELYEKTKDIILQNAFILIENPYGNYVLQVIIEHWEKSEMDEIFSFYKNKLTNLSLLKYSSNVIERSIEKYEDTLNEYVKEICAHNRIGEIMRNHFGNYVIQKALKLISGEFKDPLIKSICSHIQDLGDKKLMNKWKTIIHPHLPKGYIETI